MTMLARLSGRLPAGVQASLLFSLLVRLPAGQLAGQADLELALV